MKQKITQRERETWVLNDEFLYNMRRTSKLSMRKFIQTYREQIDAIITSSTTRDADRPAGYGQGPRSYNPRETGAAFMIHLKGSPYSNELYDSRGRSIYDLQTAVSEAKAQYPNDKFEVYNGHEAWVTPGFHGKSRRNPRHSRSRTERKVRRKLTARRAKNPTTIARGVISRVARPGATFSLPWLRRMIRKSGYRNVGGWFDQMIRDAIKLRLISPVSKTVYVFTPAAANPCPFLRRMRKGTRIRRR
jgi:hypothetical protein